MEKPNFLATNTKELHARDHMEEFTSTIYLVANNIDTLAEKHCYEYEFTLPGCLSLYTDYASVPICTLAESVSLKGVAYPVDIELTIKAVTGLRKGFLLDYDTQLRAATDFVTDNTIDLVQEIVDNPLDYVPVATLRDTVLDKEAMQETLNKAFNTLAQRLEKTLELTINEMEKKWTT